MRKACNHVDPQMKYHVKPMDKKCDNLASKNCNIETRMKNIADYDDNNNSIPKEELLNQIINSLKIFLK